MSGEIGSMAPDLFEHLPTAIHVYRCDRAEASPEPRFIAANPAAVRALGGGIKGALLEEAFPALRGTGIRELCAHAARSGASASLGEIRVDCGEDGVAALRVKTFPLGEERVGVAFEDISDLKDAHAEELRRLRIACQAAIDVVPDILFVKSEDGQRYVLSNKVSAAGVGMTTETLVGKRNDDLFPPEVVDARRTLDPVTGAPVILLEQIDITSLHDAQSTIEQQHRQILELQHAAQLTIERQHEEIALLSAPIIAVGPQIAVLPIVGTCDVKRLEQIQESVLSTIVTQRLKDVILDLTGALGLSLSSARRLTLLAKALRLLGVTPILTGIQPALARLLIEAEGFPTEILVFRDLRHALATLTAAKLPKDSVREEDSLSGEAALLIFKPPTKL
jgi:anti-anti-sigma regulatory factor